MARKKSRKKLHGVRGFAVKIFGNDIVREILGFILILGILYFVVSGALILALRTDTYWRAVISNSMKHEDESWREYFEVRGYDSSQFPLQGGFERGDMLVTQGVSSVTEISIGEVIVVDTGQRHPLVHRVVDIRNENGEARLTTKGDGNQGLLSVEKSIKPEQIRGRVIFVIPKLGHLSLWYQRE
ncbi:MAG: hypothetical protein ACE5OT_02570 [Candidatus Hadarchaeaceae archaeon]